ncbi:hypothetical protein PLESTB_000830200 [Pleodorina starrii]|uniref:Sulfotransferase n=1 Tax=Pleodorina starrii TaxID=330485 RepID=A0A9W6BLV8_9CHLO|nr:hypothetical protein PLESTM_000145600 [Pleodorina starrii]GLC54160.1 hypothetical protein PLESTB_000830200 [Pleodorina starrii]GLC64536.1 hypothetical protein PLESTF_000176400 [Pleodorina starrii]
MSTYVTHRRIIGAHKPPRASNTWTEKILSLLLVAALICLGVACVIALLQVLQPSDSATTLPVRLDPKASQQKTESAAAADTRVDPAAASSTSSAVMESAARAGAVTALDSEPSAEELARYRKAARVLDPEVMQHVPDTFDSGVKNPCWTNSSGAFRCLPYFYVTGMFHAGATSISEKLRLHPDVLTDACTGCQFWGEEGKPMSFYLEHMREAPNAIKQAPATKVLMDSSASTFAFYWAAGGKAHRGYAEAMRPCYQSCVEGFNVHKVPVADCMTAKCFNASLTADVKRATEAGVDWDTEAHNPLLVRAVYGDRPPKMILVARDPIARLYSAYHGYPHYHGKYGKSSSGFTAYVAEQVGALRTCEADFGAARCALYFEALSHREEMVYFHADQLMRGMYALFLEIWYRFIPASNWLIIHSDDLFSQPRETLARVVTFLNITRPDDATLDRMAAAGQMKSFTAGQEPVEPRARQLLAELYAPYNSKLAKLTGDARFEKWNEQPVQ